jgi:hypothetical protein
LTFPRTLFIYLCGSNFLNSLLGIWVPTGDYFEFCNPWDSGENNHWVFLWNQTIQSWLFIFLGILV